MENQENNASVQSENASVTNAPVIIQAGLGRLICEFCGADVARRTATQRFCCTPHRLAYHARARAEAEN